MLPTSYDAQNNQLQQKSSNASSAEVKTFHWPGVGGKSFVPAFRRQRQEVPHPKAVWITEDPVSKIEKREERGKTGKERGRKKN